MPETWISAAEAATLLPVSVHTIIRRVKSGKLDGKPSESAPFSSDGSENYLIRLERLPQDAQYRYHFQNVPARDKLDLDLVSLRDSLGDRFLNQLFDTQDLLQKAANIRHSYSSRKAITENLTKLALAYGISLRTLYRLEKKPFHKKASILYLDPIYSRITSLPLCV
ncbi:hypothetical protein AGMMS49992_31880 [Clostridia bacterium]|nr:hypothetical protein AGMMS49992_31880 [Clostridia bacterium]